MRWLFLILLSLNLAYIAWQLSIPATASYADVLPLKNVPPIVLLAEVEKEKSAASAQLQAQQQSDKNDKVEAVAESSIKASVKAPTVKAPTVKAPKVKPPQPAPTAEKVVAVAESCFTLGPFRDLDKLRGLTRDIAPYVKTTDFRGSEEQGQALYWVYVKPEKSYEKAVATGKRLKSKKIKDFYIISDSEKVNGLSLGRFRNKAGAYGLAKKVTKLGFDVEVEPVYKTYTNYWLDYQLASTSIPENVLKKYMRSGKTDKVSRLSRSCKG